jgi:hypothetical protein
MTPLGLTDQRHKDFVERCSAKRFDFLGIRSELTDIKQMVLGI